jgi:uncharacterized protein (DUF58 family)
VSAGARRRRDRRPGSSSRFQHRFGRLRRWLRPPRTLRPTRAGWLFFVLTLGVGFAALNTGNNLLYLVFSFLLGFLVLSGVLSEAALRRIDVVHRLPREVFAEAPAPVVLEVSNHQRRMPSFAIVVEALAGTDAFRATILGRVFVLRVGPGESIQRAYPLTAGRRGPLAQAGFRVSTRFPFGLFSKSLLIESPARLLVYPAVDPVRAGTLGVAARSHGESQSSRLGTGTEAAGLREYASGDGRRSIHWRASLRRGELLVRDREREEKAELEVHLRTRAVPPGDAFEGSVRRAASEVVAHLEEGFRVGLASDAERIPPGEGHRQRALLLTWLARVEPEPAARQEAVA